MDGWIEWMDGWNEWIGDGQSFCDTVLTELN